MLFRSAGSNLLGVGNGTSDLSAVVLGFADVVGDVVGEHHLVTVDNLDRFVVGDVLDTLGRGSGNLTARLHGHGLSKSSDDLKPVLVLHAFVLAGRLSGSPNVVVLTSGSSLKVESGLSEGVNLSHGQFTLDDEVEGLDLGHASRSSSAPVSAGSSQSGLAALKRVLSPEGVEVLLGGLALGVIELVVSNGVLESDLHDVVMDSLSDGLGLEKGGSLGSSFLGSLGGSSELGSDSTVAEVSGNVSLSETESGVTFGTSGSSSGASDHLGKHDSLSDGSLDLSFGLVDSETESSDVLSVGNLRGNSGSNGSTHGHLADSNVRLDPFVESDLLEGKSLLSFSLGNTSDGNSSSDGSLGEEEDSLHADVQFVGSLLGGNGSAENGMSVNSSSDSNSEVLLFSLSSGNDDSEFVLRSLEGSSGFLSSLLGLLEVVTDLVSVSSSLNGVSVHVSSTDNPHLSLDGHLLGLSGGVSSSLLEVEVELDSDLSDSEHLVSPSDSVLHSEVSLAGNVFGVLSSEESSGGTDNSLSHELLGVDGILVSLFSLDNFNVLEVEGNLEILMGNSGISLGFDSEGVHLLGSTSSSDEEDGNSLKSVEVEVELSLHGSDHSQPVGDSSLVDSKSDGESVSVSLAGSRFPRGMDLVVKSLGSVVLVDSVLDVKFVRGSASDMGVVLSLEGSVLAYGLLPDSDGNLSNVDSNLGELVGVVVLFPGLGGEFLLDDHLGGERGSGDLGGSGNLLEEDSSLDLNSRHTEVLSSGADSNDSHLVELGVLGLGGSGVTVGLVGSADELSGVFDVHSSLLSELSGLDVGGNLTSKRLSGGFVSVHHEDVLLGDVLHGSVHEGLSASDRVDHGLDGSLHLNDVSVASSPFTSSLSVGLSTKSDEVVSKLLFLLVSEVSSNLSDNEFLGSLLSGDTEFLLSDSESGGSSGSFSEDLSSGFHSGSGGVVLHGLSEGNLLSLNSLLVDDGPVDS